MKFGFKFQLWCQLSVLFWENCVHSLNISSSTGIIGNPSSLIHEIIIMIKNNVNKVHKTVYVQHNTVDNKY